MNQSIFIRTNFVEFCKKVHAVLRPNCAVLRPNCTCCTEAKLYDYQKICNMHNMQKRICMQKRAINAPINALCNKCNNL